MPKDYQSVQYHKFVESQLNYPKSTAKDDIYKLTHPLKHYLFPLLYRMPRHAAFHIVKLQTLLVCKRMKRLSEKLAKKKDR